MSTQPSTFLSPEQYLEIERRAEYKSEYYRGEMFAMAGASEPHNVLVFNLLFELGQQLSSRDCRVYPSDLRLRVNETGLYTYPDVMVVCGKPELADGHRDVLLNPDLIAEVLSPSTEAYDRGRKSGHYRTIGALKGYLLVAADRKSVELYTRQPDGTWLLTEASGDAGALELPFLDCRLALSGLYRNVNLPESEQLKPAQASAQ